MSRKSSFFNVKTAGFLITILATTFFIFQFISSKLRMETSSDVLNDQYENMREAGIPRFESQDLSGARFVLEPNQKHKILIINFWASWCGPCVDEFPSLIKLVNHFKGDVGLLAVSLDSNKKEMTEFLKIFGVQKEEHITLLWDPEYKVAESFGTSKLPESYVVTSDLRLIKKIAGSIDWMDQDIIGLLQSALQ